MCNQQDVLFLCVPTSTPLILGQAALSGLCHKLYVLPHFKPERAPTTHGTDKTCILGETRPQACSQITPWSSGLGKCISSVEAQLLTVGERALFKSIPIAKLVLCFPALTVCCNICSLSDRLGAQDRQFCYLCLVFGPANIVSRTRVGHL